MATRRPNLDIAVRSLIRHVARTMPEFAHIKASRILVIAGEARRASRATVKPLTFAGGRSTDKLTGRRKPIIRIAGKRMLYSITLRPLFFRDSTPQGRIETLLHELFHIAPEFDGTLDRARRHARMGKEFARVLRPLVKRYLKTVPRSEWEAFSYDGEVLVQQWLERPSATFLPDLASMRRVYSESHLFLGPVRMITPKKLARPAKKRAPRVLRLN